MSLGALTMLEARQGTGGCRHSQRLRWRGWMSSLMQRGWLGGLQRGRWHEDACGGGWADAGAARWDGLKGWLVDGWTAVHAACARHMLVLAAVVLLVACSDGQALQC